jgi:hypothetical protein
MKKSLAEIKDQLMGEELLTRVTQSKFKQGMEEMPVKKMMDQALHIKENLLPRIAKKQGNDSAEYNFFTEVYNSLLWSIVLCDRYESLERRYGTQKLYNLIAREHLELLEREVQRRGLVEEIEMTSGLDAMRRSIRFRAEELLRETKNTAI